MTTYRFRQYEPLPPPPNPFMLPVSYALLFAVLMDAAALLWVLLWS